MGLTLGVDVGGTKVLGGVVEGPRLTGRAVPQSGGDWPRFWPDGLVEFEAHYLLGIARCMRGDFASGCSELEECIRLYGNEAREVHRLLYGQDAKASALGWLAMARCGIGPHVEQR